MIGALVERPAAQTPQALSTTRVLALRSGGSILGYAEYRVQCNPQPGTRQFWWVISPSENPFYYVCTISLDPSGEMLAQNNPEAITG